MGCKVREVILKDSEHPFRFPQQNVWTPYNLIKLALAPLALLRLVGMSLCFVLAWICATLAISGTKLQAGDDSKPLSRSRKAVLNAVVFFARGVLFFCGFHYIETEGV